MRIILITFGNIGDYKVLQSFGRYSVSAIESYANITKDKRNGSGPVALAILQNRIGIALAPARKGFVSFGGFIVRIEDVARVEARLITIGSLSDLHKQFIATMIDTEAAIGYYRYQRHSNLPDKWRAYICIKMKTRGDVAHFAELIGLTTPQIPKQLYNTLKGSYDLAWCTQTVGIPAYVIMRTVLPFLFNEKSKHEAACILRHGPFVSTQEQHPFIQCGAVPVRRGVWRWPSTTDSINTP